MTTECDIEKEPPGVMLDTDDDDDNKTPTSLGQDDLACCEGSLTNIPDSQIPGPSQGSNLFRTKSCSEDQKFNKADARTTPKHLHTNNTKGNSKFKQSSGAQGNIRLCEEHNFLTDITEVRQMEQGLLKLLDDFHSGKLQAFGRDCTFDKMEQVREQQERLARLHFELNAQQEIYGPQSEEGRGVARENLGKLIENLQQLSHSIEQLQISSPSVQTDV